jgi:anthranilate 1,2-dioxygenase large subunit
MDSEGVPTGLDWPADDLGRVPYQVFTDAALYQREQERIFRGPLWHYVGLEAEVPRPGDYKTTHIGEDPVILSRGQTGQLHVLVNRCAHRGSIVLREGSGNSCRFQCVYHRWEYEPDGTLAVVPFQNGLGGAGGYDASFSKAGHGLKRLRVETFNGLVFATFSERTPPLPEYLGPIVGPRMARVFDGRELIVLGQLRHTVKANWKHYLENVFDAYHAGLLHGFASAFNIFNPAQRAESISDRHGVGMAMTWVPEGAESREPPRAAKPPQGHALQAPELVHALPERDQEIRALLLIVSPTFIGQRMGNCLSTRQVIPRGVDSFEQVWTLFGYADDSPELRESRLIHGNMTGPAGYVHLEDFDALENTHKGIQGARGESAFLQMGGTSCEAGKPQPTMADEGQVRLFWRVWREWMGV